MNTCSSLFYNKQDMNTFSSLFYNNNTVPMVGSPIVLVVLRPPVNSYTVPCRVRTKTTVPMVGSPLLLVVLRSPVNYHSPLRVRTKNTVPMVRSTIVLVVLRPPVNSHSPLYSKNQNHCPPQLAHPWFWALVDNRERCSKTASKMHPKGGRGK